MKILLIGSNGQLGSEIQNHLPRIGKVFSYSKEKLDIENFNKLKKIFGEINPDIVVNCAAYTAVDKAEDNENKAFKINFECVDYLSNLSQENNSLFIHYSTDYVFDGKKNKPYSETDQANPMSVYGKSKLAGEETIRKKNKNFLIFRTSWVYSLSDDNFVSKIINKAKNENSVNIVNDQYGIPTSVEFLSNITLKCIEKLISDSHKKKSIMKTYHLTPDGFTTWFDFAKLFLSELEKKGIKFKSNSKKIKPIKTSDLNLMAQRPINSVLSNYEIKNDFKLSIPKWEFYVYKLIQNLYDKHK